MANRIQQGFTTYATLIASIGSGSFQGIWREMDRDRVRLPDLPGSTLQAQTINEGNILGDRFSIIWTPPAGTDMSVITDASRRLVGFPVAFTARGTQLIQFCTAGTTTRTAVTFSFSVFTLGGGLGTNPYNHPTGTFLDDITELYSVWMWDRVDSDGFQQASQPDNLSFRQELMIDLPPISETIRDNFPLQIRSRNIQTETLNPDGTILIPARESLVGFINGGIGDRFDLDNRDFINAARFDIGNFTYSIDRFIVLNRGDLLVEFVR